MWRVWGLSLTPCLLRCERAHHGLSFIVSRDLKTVTGEARLYGSTTLESVKICNFSKHRQPARSIKRNGFVECPCSPRNESSRGLVHAWCKIGIVASNFGPRIIRFPNPTSSNLADVADVIDGRFP